MPFFNAIALGALALSAATASPITESELNARQFGGFDGFGGFGGENSDSAAGGSGTSGSCAPIHLIVVRASTEPPGDGAIGSLAQAVIQAHPGATQEAIQYPATLTNYVSSESQGVSAMKQQLTSYANNCPDAQIVLLGYSQGAQVSLDALCGGGSTGANSDGVSQDVGKHVAAVVVYGDPGYNAGKPWDKGTAKQNGIFPRASDACTPYGDVIESYCDTGDPYCASGGNLQVHLSYVSKYNDQALQFINSKLNAPSSSE